MFIYSYIVILLHVYDTFSTSSRNFTLGVAYSSMNTIPTHNAPYFCTSEHPAPLAGELLQVFLHSLPLPQADSVPPPYTQVQASAPLYCGMQETCTIVVGWNTPRQRALGNAHQPRSRKLKPRSSAYGGASPQLRQHQRPQQPDPSPQWWQHRPHPYLPAAQRYCRHYYYCCR